MSSSSSCVPKWRSGPSTLTGVVARTVSSRNCCLIEFFDPESFSGLRVSSETATLPVIVLKTICGPLAVKPSYFSLAFAFLIVLGIGSIAELRIGSLMVVPSTLLPCRRQSHIAHMTLEKSAIHCSAIGRPENQNFGSGVPGL